MTAAVAQFDRWAEGPGELICDVCGSEFDPCEHDWTCPHCSTAWPWAAEKGSDEDTGG